MIENRVKVWHRLRVVEKQMKNVFERAARKEEDENAKRERLQSHLLGIDVFHLEHLGNLLYIISVELQKRIGERTIANGKKRLLTVIQ